MKYTADRIALDYSPLSDEIRVGYVNAKKTEFLWERECTFECILQVIEYMIARGNEIRMTRNGELMQLVFQPVPTTPVSLNPHE